MPMSPLVLRRSVTSVGRHGTSSLFIRVMLRLAIIVESKAISVLVVRNQRRLSVEDRFLPCLGHRLIVLTGLFEVCVS